MLKHFKIKSSLKNYEIFFTSNFKIITKKNNSIVICDSFFKKTFYQLTIAVLMRMINR